jgi:hypothetical protein
LGCFIFNCDKIATFLKNEFILICNALILNLKVAKKKNRLMIAHQTVFPHFLNTKTTTLFLQQTTNNKQQTTLF